MSTVTSRDGSTIAFDRSGEGPPVILVVGAFNDRATGAPLAEALQARFTVFNYDRRGRGASGDTAPYSVEREVEDIDALIEAAGGSAAVFGYSSGAILALTAAARGSAITRLALYEPPFTVDENAPPPPVDHADRLAELVAAGRRGDAVEYFQTEIVGIPAESVAQMRNAPFRPALEAIAHTLVYDASIVGDGRLPAGSADSVTVPTLVISGADSPEEMRRAAWTAADALPDARHRSLEGQTHDIVPAAVAPVLEEFIGG